MDLGLSIVLAIGESFGVPTSFSEAVWAEGFALGVTVGLKRIAGRRATGVTFSIFGTGEGVAESFDLSDRGVVLICSVSFSDTRDMSLGPEVFSFCSFLTGLAVADATGVTFAEGIGVTLADGAGLALCDGGFERPGARRAKFG